MSTPYFTQERSIDPYSSYYSNIVNTMHRMVTRGIDSLHSARAMDIETSDSTSVIMIPGFLYKDDVSIENSANFTIDFADSNMYASFGAGFNEAGYYAVTIDYTYAKSRPAPQAKVQIFKPSQRGSITSRYFFLKSVLVTYDGSTFEVASVHDSDSTYPLQKRVYTQVYVGTEDTTPVFDQTRDEARIIYVRDKDEIYYGASQSWVNITAIKDSINTASCTLNQLGYVSTSGEVQPAIATGLSTFADCVVIGVGTLESGDGKVRLYGRSYNIPIESGRSVTPGENVYLSDTEAGTVTDMIPEPYGQYVGTCVAAGDSTTTCDIWFMPGSEGSGGDYSQSIYDRYQDLLLTSIYKRLTLDTFLNDDRIDAANTTATIDTINHEIDGNVGKTFKSDNLTELGYDGTCIVSCQISSKTTGDDLTWYASNNGGTEWEETGLDDIHTFGTNIIPIDSTGDFTIGEVIIGNASLVTAIIRGNYGSYITVSNMSGTEKFTVGESITGQTSGVNRTVGSQSERTDGYTDLRVRCDFGAVGTIDDYGILYDVDESIVPSNFENNERNIETLYSDLYAIPSIDDDGSPNLSVSIEECKDNIKTFVGSEEDYQTVPPYTSFGVIDSTSSLTAAISTIDAAISGGLAGDDVYIRDFIGKSVSGVETPQYTSHDNIDSTANLTAAISQLDAAIGLTIYDKYQDLLLGSIYKRLTLNSFLDADRTDLVNTTAYLDNINKEMDGSSGETYRSTDLVETAYDGTCIVSCQLSAKTTGDDLTWYASNNGGAEWEALTLDDIHTFATNTLPIDTTGFFVVGEVIVGTSSSVTAIISTVYSSYLLIKTLSGVGTFSNGEIITGQTSLTTATAGIQSDRNDGYTDLRVRCDFGAVGTIDDYGILYDVDETIAPVTFTDNEKNIETLFSDIYTTPSIDNDGLPNLTTAIEECKDNIKTFIGSEGDYQSTPPYTSTSIIDSTSSLAIAISQLDVAVSGGVAGDDVNIRDFIGKSGAGVETPNYSSHDNIDSTANLEIAISQLDDAVTSTVANVSLLNKGRTITDGDATPSILDGAGDRCGLLLTSNSGATTITNFDDAIDRTTFSIYFGDNNTTIQSNPGILMQGDSDFEGKLYDIVTFRKLPSGWLEIARRTGSGSYNVTGYGNFALNDATPTISGYKNWFTNTDSTSLTTITNLDDAREGDEVTIIFEDANTTITSNVNIVLNSDAIDFNGSIGDSITLIYAAGVWYEKGRASPSYPWATYLHSQLVAGDPWSVIHNLGQRICHVTVTDLSGNIVIPNNVEFVDANNATVTFLANSTGYARFSK